VRNCEGSWEIAVGKFRGGVQEGGRAREANVGQMSDGTSRKLGSYW
jgi:hypothetical protein